MDSVYLKKRLLSRFKKKAIKKWVKEMEFFGLPSNLNLQMCYN
jgi:hypothetical protein